MHVVLDTRNTPQSGGTGIATYARTLATACHHADLPVSWLGGASSGASRFSLLTRLRRSLHGRRRVVPAAHGYEVNELYRTAVSRYRKFSKITMLRNDAPPAIMHWTCPLPLHWEGTRNVVTVHDLIPLLHPELATTVYRNIGHFLKEACDSAHAVVTISEAVRSDIIGHLGISEKKVFNLSQAVEFNDQTLRNAHKAESGFPDGGFLYFGTLEKRKNLTRLVRAHGISKTKRPLILVGKLDLGGAEILAAIESHPAPHLVHIIPWVHREVLIRGIQHARAVVFPSLAEGFGLPIIEAMLLGTPVMTSRAHATEEIAGGAALIIDPYDVESMVDALQRLDRDEALVERLRFLGRNRSGDFSISGYSSRLSQFYRSVTAT